MKLALGLFVLTLVGCAAPTTGNKVVISPVSREEAERQQRAELSRNDSVVEFRRSCPGLFIPIVRSSRFEGVVPVYVMRVLNNSSKRYSIKYDLTMRERTSNVLVRSISEFTEERNFVMRPNSYTEFILAKSGQYGAGRQIIGIQRLVVLSCEAT